MKNHDPMSNKTKGPIPLPAGDVPSGTRCVSLCIPDSNEAYRTLVGALYELTHWNNWDRDGEHRGTLWAQAWRAALMEGMLQCNQFRNNGGQLEFSGDGGVTWTPVNTIPPNQSANDPKTTGTMQPARGGANAQCLAARNAAECIHQLHTYMVNWYETYGTALTIAEFLLSIIVIFLPLEWPVGLAIVAYTALCNSMLTLADALNTGAWDTAVTEALTCILYCNADTAGRWSQAAFDEIRFELQAKGEHIYDLIDLWLDQVIGIVGLNNAGTTTSIPSYDCGACDCQWCYTFDLTQTDAGLRYDPGDTGQTGVWTLTQGWIFVPHNVSGTHWTCGGFLTLDPFTSTNITQIIWEGHGLAEYTEGSDHICGWSGGSDTTPFVTPLEHVFRPNVAATMLYYGVSRGVYISGIPSNWIMTRLTVKGTGTCPFGTPNC